MHAGDASAFLFFSLVAVVVAAAGGAGGGGGGGCGGGALLWALRFCYVLAAQDCSRMSPVYILGSCRWPHAFSIFDATVLEVTMAREICELSERDVQKCRSSHVTYSTGTSATCVTRLSSASH